MEKSKIRTAMLLGEAAVEGLAHRLVVVAGLGGVGSFAVEALVRAGVGRLILIDHDEIDESNINRQLQATPGDVGKSKAGTLALRVLSIRPETSVEAITEFITPDNVSRLIPDNADFIIDAVDNVPAKVALCALAKNRDIPIISSMGMGNRLDPTQIYVRDIFQTSGCPLAKVMRRELRKAGIESLRVAVSDEPPASVHEIEPTPPGARRPPGSVSFVPSVCGLILAGEAIKWLCGGG